MIKLETIKVDPFIIQLLKESDKTTKAIGYTEHGLVHADTVSKMALELCNSFGFEEQDTEIAIVSAFLHDIGNLAGRENHGQIGASIVTPILLRHDVEPRELPLILSAIANHDDIEPVISTKISAIVLLADKSDVRRSRVRETSSNIENLKKDIHDRVNYAVLDRILKVENGDVVLNLKLDSQFASSADYLDIFAKRTSVMRRAARFLGHNFHLLIDGIQIY